MTTRVLIIGGYGNFGRFIARMLAREAGIQLIIAGRNAEKAKALAAELSTTYPAEAVVLDIHHELAASLARIRPHVVVHTSGPYQGQGYAVAEACIRQGCHYVDLADARDFVAGITALDAQAREKGVLVCSGASSVPCLTAAIIDAYKGAFAKLDTVEYAISTAQRTNRGLATTAAVLSYAGKPFTTRINGRMQNVYGWLGLTWRRFWGLNLRPLGNCDIPDLAIFPERYPDLQTIRFRAGLELKPLHLLLVAFSWLVRVGILPSLQPLAKPMLKTSFLFDAMGTEDSGFYMELSGTDADGKPKRVLFELVAKQGDGLYIPSMPAILMAKKLAQGGIAQTGATPCVDLISLEEYLAGLSEFNIQWRVV